jgi:hypothetical protein
LWTFCQTTGSQAELTAHIIQRMAEDGEAIDWWNAAGRTTTVDWESTVKTTV